jgi:hypothetical protein
MHKQGIVNFFEFDLCVMSTLSLFINKIASGLGDLCCFSGAFSLRPYEVRVWPCDSLRIAIRASLIWLAPSAAKDSSLSSSRTVFAGASTTSPFPANGIGGYVSLLTGRCALVAVLHLLKHPKRLMGLSHQNTGQFSFL